MVSWPIAPSWPETKFVRDFLAILCTLKHSQGAAEKEAITWFRQVSWTCQRGSASALLRAVRWSWFSQLKAPPTLCAWRSPSQIPDHPCPKQHLLRAAFSDPLRVKSASWPVAWSPGSPCLPQSMKSSFVITCLSISLPSKLRRQVCSYLVPYCLFRALHLGDAGK